MNFKDVKPQKKFDGKFFVLDGLGESKSQARLRAKRLKTDGDNVRIIKSGHGYDGYSTYSRRKRK